MIADRWYFDSQEMDLDGSRESSEASFALEAAVWIMVALADQPKHGYAIMKDIQDLGGFSMRPGTLYAALMRMERAQLVEEIQTHDYRRRPFKLTEAGRKRLGADLKTLAALASTGLRRLKGRKSGRKGAQL
jgi:DNA-binding PadR family transcriptional regulator